VVVGREIDFHHVLGDPRAGEYERFRAFYLNGHAPGRTEP
jgi:hypothetical protein